MRLLDGVLVVGFSRHHGHHLANASGRNGPFAGKGSLRMTYSSQSTISSSESAEAAGAAGAAAEEEPAATEETAGATGPEEKAAAAEEAAGAAEIVNKAVVRLALSCNPL